MEFRFNVNRLLPLKINKISHTLIPEDFRGDRREFNECQRLVSRVLDDMGEASANAQGLSKPITSASKLRDTDHLVYLLVDSQGNNGMGTVVGLLKTGSKNLFMFDENGLHYQLQPRCILDFYIHESRQRTGLGNVLYQHMLAEEETRPVKLAIDRPSEKFLQFLRKYYGLDRIIPQNNKFVVFRGFFDDESHDPRSSRYGLQSRSNSDEDPYGNNNNHTNNGSNNCKSASSNGAPYSGLSRSAYGRYAAARPPCSMANIIHNATVLGQTAERTGVAAPKVLPSVSADPKTEQVSHSSLTNGISREPLSAAQSKLERPRSLSLYSEEDRKQRAIELSAPATPALPEHRPVPALAAPEEVAESQHRQNSASVQAPKNKRAPSAAFGPLVERRGAEVVPSSESSTERAKPATAAGTGSVGRAVGAPPTAAGSSSASRRETVAEKTAGAKASPSCAQEVGGNQNVHLDLKFYHSPLW